MWWRFLQLALLVNYHLIIIRVLNVSNCHRCILNARLVLKIENNGNPSKPKINATATVQQRPANALNDHKYYTNPNYYTTTITVIIDVL